MVKLDHAVNRDTLAHLAKEANEMKRLMVDMSSLVEMQTVDLGIADNLVADSQTSTTIATGSLLATGEANLQPMTTAFLLAIIGMCTLGPLGGVLGGTLGTIGGVTSGAFVGVAYYSSNKSSQNPTNSHFSITFFHTF